MENKGRQLITAFYNYKQKDGFDKVTIVYKNEKGEKDFTIVDKPTIEYAISKDYIDPTVEVRSIKKEDCILRKCYYKDIYKDIVTQLNDENLKLYMDQVFAQGTAINKGLQKIHLDYRVHGSDINITDFYISKFLKKYPHTDNYFGISKFFFDIETDGALIKGFPFAERAEVPINIISSCFQDERGNLSVYMFVLNYGEKFKELYNVENEQFIDFFSSEKMKKNLTEIKQVAADKLGVDIKDLKFKVKRYDDEINLIYDFYHTINTLKPDFVGGWNTHKYDHIYLYNRIKNLGYQPETIMCPDEFPYKGVSYRIDNDKDPTDNNSRFNVHSYSIFVDMMNLYANIRKPQGKKESYSLDFTVEQELGEHKQELDTSIKTQAYDNYYTFFLYSVIDTVLLAKLENKTKDMDTLYTIGMITNTRVEEGLKKTISLRNLGAKFYETKGYFISNNRSSLKEKTEKIPGAFVGDPELVDFCGMEIMKGIKSKYVFEEVGDVDLSSLYPSIILALNLSPETFDRKVYFKKIRNDGVNYEVISYEKEFIDDYISRDYISVGKKYLGLPSINDLSAALSV